jgi:hypothetical protein
MPGPGLLVLFNVFGFELLAQIIASPPRLSSGWGDFVSANSKVKRQQLKSEQGNSNDPFAHRYLLP